MSKLAKAEPKLMLEIHAKGLPHAMLLDLETCRDLHAVLGNVLTGFQPKADPSGESDGEIGNEGNHVHEVTKIS